MTKFDVIPSEQCARFVVNSFALSATRGTQVSFYTGRVIGEIALKLKLNECSEKRAFTQPGTLRAHFFPAEEIINHTLSLNCIVRLRHVRWPQFRWRDYIRAGTRKRRKLHNPCGRASTALQLMQSPITRSVVHSSVHRTRVEILDGNWIEAFSKRRYSAAN